MHHLKRIIKVSVRIVAGFVGFVLLYLVFAVLLSIIPVNRNPQHKAEVGIYLLTNGVHSDIAVPIKSVQYNWRQILPVPDTSYRYLALGWGDKNFYINTASWSQLKMSVAFKAVAGLSESALHASFYKQLTESKTCVRINISQEQYLKLVDYLNQSFKKDSVGHITQIATLPGMYGPHEVFFDATRRYSIFYTCNTWTNNALKACGQKACLWTPFDKGIFYQYNR